MQERGKGPITSPQLQIQHRAPFKSIHVQHASVMEKPLCDMCPITKRPWYSANDGASPSQHVSRPTGAIGRSQGCHIGRSVALQHSILGLITVSFTSTIHSKCRKGLQYSSVNVCSAGLGVQPLWASFAQLRPLQEFGHCSCCQS